MLNRYRKELLLLAVLVVVCIFLTIRNPQFLSPTNLQNITRQIGMYGILSIGVAVVVVTGGIDLSVGSMCALLGVLMAMGLVEKKMPPAVVIPGILAIGGALGWLHGILVSRLKLQPFIVTLCGLLLYRGAARFVASDESKGFGDSAGFEPLKQLATGSVAGMSTAFVLFLIVTVLVGVLLHKSVLGRHLYAVGKNSEAARYAGVNVLRVETIAYVIAGVCTGVAAILFAFYTNSIAPSSHGSYYELYGVAAVVLGGFSLRGGECTVIGVVLGVILLQVLQNLVNLLGVPSSLNFAVMGFVILIGALLEKAFQKKAA